MIVRMHGCYLVAISFRIPAGMLSGHWALFGFNSVSNFATPITVIWVGRHLWGSVLVGEVGEVGYRFSLVNTDWNWFERISAVDLLPV